ncbi:MAG: hypothetical protein IT377_15420 [Polyangiaceae bacterium]|nr:hypothetical protein [Polyangiaceae bacterium]
MASLFPAVCICWVVLGCGSSDETKGSGGSGGTSGASGGGAAGAGGAAPFPAPVGCTPGGSVSVGTHAYFETLRARSECHVALSLRDAKHVATDLEGGYSGHGSPPDVTYDPANDSYPDKQDAAKIVVPADKNSLPNQVKLPIQILHGERAVITWDAWFGPEFDYANHQIPTYKMWQFCSYSDGIWDEVRARWSLGPSLGPGALAAVDGRTYSEVVGPSVTSKQPLEPQVASFTLWQKRWIRYWGLFEPDGAFDAYSLWMADANTDPVKLFDRVPLQFRSNKEGTAAPRLGVFRIEFNTSTNALAAGRSALVAYVRNYVVLKGDLDVAAILERPQP